MARLHLARDARNKPGTKHHGVMFVQLGGDLFQKDDALVRLQWGCRRQHNFQFAIIESEQC